MPRPLLLSSWRGSSPVVRDGADGACIRLLPDSGQLGGPVLSADDIVCSPRRSFSYLEVADVAVL